MAALIDQASKLAEACLANELPRRWCHVRAVASKASRISSILAPEDAEILVASAWLHDVGYADEAVRTGLHGLDGANWLLDQGISERIASLVAYHSCARYEAEERGLVADLTEAFEQENSATADALWYSDMTTGPDGEDLDVRDRLSEIRKRYGPDHVVTQFWGRAEPTLIAAVQRVQSRLGS